MDGLVAVDVSEWQTAVTDAYTRDWLIFRVCDGTYRDKRFAANLAWAKNAASDGRLAGFTVYCVYRPGAATLATVKAMVGVPHPKMTVMIDVESWGGQIHGDHSGDITKLANALAAWLGDRRRVLAYGNQNDLATIYPKRPSWLRLIVASYGIQRPAVPNMIGWQYSDGDGRWPTADGLPRSSAPFGACDHNVFPGLTAAELAETLGVGDDMPLSDADVQKIANAVWSKQFTHADSKTTAPASSWLVYGNRFALAASKVQSVAVDTAAVAADIKNRVITLLGGHA